MTENTNDNTFDSTESVKEGLVNYVNKSYNEIIINIDDEVDSPSKYRGVYDALYKADSKDSVTVILNTPGGYLATQNQMVNCLLDTKAKTKAIIHEASSAGVGIALACDEVEVKKFGYMFIHNASTCAFGKVNEVTTRTDHLKTYWRTIMSELYRGFLTEVEIQQVFEGKDFYFHKDEIEKRLLNWIPMRKRS